MQDQEVTISPALQKLIDTGVVHIQYVRSWRELDPETVEGGGQLYMGDYDASDYNRHETTLPPIFTVDGTAWGDYAGSCVDRSNYRALLADHPTVFIDCYGGWGSAELALPASFGRVEEEGWEGWAEDFADTLIAMNHDYPLYSDEDHSRLEMELAEEAWDQYLGWDVRRELQDISASEDWQDMVDAIEEDWLRERYYTLTFEIGNCYPYCESATSIVFPDHRAVVQAIAEEIGESK